jgi:hypothetical protein
LFRWFVGLGLDAAVWSPTTFSKNRDRLLTGDIATAFFEAVLLHAETERLLSDDHFTVDGTLLRRGRATRVFSPAIKIRRPTEAAIRPGISMGNPAAT